MGAESFWGHLASFPCCPFQPTTPHPHPPLIIIPIFGPLPHRPPCLHPTFSVLGLSVCVWRGGRLGSRACCCDLDFNAETVPGADSQRALFLYQPGRATAGPFCLLAPGCASERACKCLFLVGVVLALPPGSLCVCHSACYQGRLVCSGPSRRLGMGTSGPMPHTL